MSVFAEYAYEMEGIFTIEKPYGFIQYMPVNDNWSEVIVANIYVKPEARGTGKCDEMWNEVKEIIKKKGCSLVMSKVWVVSNTSSESMKMQLRLGFRLFKTQGEYVWLCKEI